MLKFSKGIYQLIYKKITYYSLLLFTLISFNVKAQFEINGSAVHKGSGEYLLTPASAAQVGSIWFKSKISLEESFDLDFELYFGTKNGGADGISFCLQPLSTSIGVSGGGLGIQGVNPSFIAEFDTYRNSGDPDFDHIAIQKNGDILNSGVNNLVSAVRIKSGVDDVENGKWHPMQVKWNAFLKKFDIYVDCILRVSYTGDIVNSIFKGNPNVYWGFTASTGGANNEHKVRNVRTNLIKLDDQDICKNGNIQVNLPPTTSKFSWLPTTGINNINSLNPIFSPTQTTDYIITYDGFCNTLIKDTFSITVNSAESNLGNDTTICDSETLILDAGFGESYLWNTNATTQEININTNGTYSVKVTHNNGCVSYDEIVLNTISCSCVDTDGDGVCNKDDLDDDNDGILDEVECPTAQVTTTFQTSGGATTSFNAPAADKGFLFNIYELDNSFNLNVNGADLVPDQIQCQGVGSPGESKLVFVSDKTGYGYAGNDNIWVIQGTKQSPVIQVNINQLGEVSIFGKRNTSAKLEPMIIKSGHPQTQILTWNPTGVNKVVLSQKVIGTTSITGEGFGVMDCNEDTDGDGILNYLDTDSDGDGCLDALEGAAKFDQNNLSGEVLNGTVDINGVPTLANGGQGIGTSKDPSIIALACIPPVVVVDTFYVCKGATVTIKKDSVAIGEWSGKEPFTKISEGSIEVMPTKSTTYYLSSFIKKQNNLVNGDFEKPYRNSFGIISDATVPGWSTTASDRMMEFWVDGFLNTPSYTGVQFVELNANMPAALYQDMSTIPGNKLIWGFAHRGRSGVELMHFEVGPPGGPYVKVKTVSTGMNWEYYSGVYVVPTGQTATRFHYTSAMPGSTGNLLDAIEFYSIEEKVDSFVVIIKKSGELKLGNDTAICQGENLSISSNITGIYNWSNGENSKTIEVNKTGIYSLEIQDSNNCLTIDSIELQVNPLPSIDLGSDTTLCTGENLKLNAQNPGLNYSWSSGETSQTINISNKGEYGVVVRDNLGCSESDSVLISFRSLPIVDIGNDTSICEVDEINLNALNPGLNFKWNTNEISQIITINKTGLYSVEVRDNFGCTESDSMLLTINPTPLVNIGSDTTICQGENLLISANIAGIYNWSNGENSKTIEVNKTGIYSLEIQDLNNCLTTDSIELIVIPLPSINLGNDTTLCAGENLKLNAQNPGLIYSWGSGETSQTINISNKGEYGVIVSDNFGCSESDSVLISFRSLPIVYIGNDTSICEVDEINLNALNNGLNFKWNTNEISQTIRVNKTGVYGVEVRDNFGCTGSDSLLLTINVMPLVNIGNDTSICFGESIVLNALNPGLNYVWNSGETSQTVNINLAGTYGVEIRDNIGCIGSDSLILKINPLPFVKLANDTNICEVDKINLNALNPGLNFKWNTNETSQTITVNKTGIYGVEVRDNFGCLGGDSMLLTVNPMPLVNIGNDTAICIGESIVLNALNPGLNCVWNSGETSKTVVKFSEGVYGVEVRDNIGCVGSDSLTLKVNQLPVVNLGNDTTICMYQTLLLDAENPRFYYKWNTGSTTQKVIIDQEALYRVEVRDKIGCLGSDEIMVYKDIIPNPFTDKSKILCEGDKITLEPDPGYSDYFIFWLSNTQKSSIDVAETGTYSSVVKSVFCKDTFEINVTKIDTPDVLIIDLNGKSSYCFDFETTRLLIESNDGNNNKFNWNDFGEIDEVEIIESGEYKVEVSNDYCLSRYSINIEEYCTGKLFIPNSFSPNGDRINDIFKPISNSHVDGYELIIYDRWGAPIFITNKIEEGWDGKIKGNIVLIDTYVYKISYNYGSKNGGIERSETIGSITLLR